MFNELVNLYCSYCDLADYYFWDCLDWNWREKYAEYRLLARNLEKILAGMCE